MGRARAGAVVTPSHERFGREKGESAPLRGNAGRSAGGAARAGSRQAASLGPLRPEGSALGRDRPAAALVACPVPDSPTISGEDRGGYGRADYTLSTPRPPPPPPCLSGPT